MLLGLGSCACSCPPLFVVLFPPVVWCWCPLGCLLLSVVEEREYTLWKYHSYLLSPSESSLLLISCYSFLCLYFLFLLLPVHLLFLFPLVLSQLFVLYSVLLVMFLCSCSHPGHLLLRYTSLRRSSLGHAGLW